DRAAQVLAARGRRVRGELAEARRQRALHELGRRMARLADAEADVRDAGRRRHALEQSAQLLERIGLEQREARIHPASPGSDRAPGSASSATGSGACQPGLRCSAATVVLIPPRTKKRAV